MLHVILKTDRYCQILIMLHLRQVIVFTPIQGDERMRTWSEDKVSMSHTYHTLLSCSDASSWQ